MHASFGGWLRQRRRALDLTQDELARAVGCSVVTIRKLESDERRPSRQIAERLAASLQIAPDDRAAFIGLARAEAYVDRAAGPATSDAPLRPRSNLPLPLTRLIGRRQDLSAVRSALLRGDTRLVTVAGPPGIGKTRLAIEAAGELREAFPDGVWFVALAAVRDAGLVVGMIARALGLREGGSQPQGELLNEYLTDRRLLLVLDNFEQVVAAAPRVVALLETSPGLKVLVTSRATLRVRGEHVHPIAPLALPDPARLPDLRDVGQSPAVALFVERAQAVLPSFALTPENAPVVAQLCARLDGLPLAIELVAVRIRMLAPANLLATLERRLPVLTDGPRDLPERHQTLRAALAGSYELLDGGAQALFRRLGIFLGGWTVEAAAALTVEQIQTAPSQPVMAPLFTQLSTLVEHSLVVQRPPSDAAPRFTMLETIREYAQELQAEHGERRAVQERHAAYFLALAERAEPELHGPDQVVWLDRLEAEYPNLRTALEGFLATQDIRTALRLAGSLWWLWFVRGASAEGRRWLGRVAAAADDAGSERLDRPLVGRVLLADGHLALFQGDFAHARAQLERSADIWRALAHPGRAAASTQQGLTAALTFQIVAAQFQGDMAAVHMLLPEYMALGATLDDPRARALLLFSLSRGALLQQGNYQAARAQSEQSLALFRSHGDLWYIVQVLSDLGLIALYEADYDAAQARYAEALAVARTLKDPALVALVLNNLGEAARCRDDDAQAAACYAESLELHEAAGNRQETPRLLHNLGYVALHRGDAAAATTYFRDSHDRFAQLGMTRGVAESLAGLAAVAAAKERPTQAARLWGAAEGLHALEGTPVWPADAREHKRYQLIARARIDPASWEAAWAAGRDSPLSEGGSSAMPAADHESG